MEFGRRPMTDVAKMWGNSDDAFSAAMCIRLRGNAWRRGVKRKKNAARTKAS